MKILFDECVPRALKKYLTDHECTTVPEAGLAGTENDELLSLAQRAKFDVSLTVDRDVEHQQNLSGRKIIVVILRAQKNSLPRLVPLVPALLSRLPTAAPGELIVIDTPS